MTPEFTHCALHVRDLDESIAFYESYCGLRIVKEHGKGKERTVWMAHAGEGDGSCSCCSAEDPSVRRARTI